MTTRAAANLIAKSSGSVWRRFARAATHIESALEAVEFARVGGDSDRLELAPLVCAYEIAAGSADVDDALVKVREFHARIERLLAEMRTQPVDMVDAVAEVMR